MKAGPLLFTSCAALLLSTSLSFAGPCNTANKDAGYGPTPGRRSIDHRHRQHRRSQR